MLKNSLLIPTYLSLALLASTVCLSGATTLAHESKLLAETPSPTPTDSELQRSQEKANRLFKEAESLEPELPKQGIAKYQEALQFIKNPVQRVFTLNRIASIYKSDSTTPDKAIDTVPHKRLLENHEVVNIPSASLPQVLTQDLRITSTCKVGSAHLTTSRSV